MIYLSYMLNNKAGKFPNIHKDMMIEVDLGDLPHNTLIWFWMGKLCPLKITVGFFFFKWRDLLRYNSQTTHSLI